MQNLIEAFVLLMCSVLLVDTTIPVAIVSSRPLVIPIVPGPTPTTVSQSSGTAFVIGPTSLTVSANFTAGNYILLGATWTDTTTPPTSITCGTKTATFIVSHTNTQVTQTTALYYIASADGGAQSCTITNPASTSQGLIAQEIHGTSGVDVSAGGVGITTYPHLDCGTLTTTGVNRLGVVWGGGLDNPTVASSGYSSLFTVRGYVLASLGLSTSGTTGMSVDDTDYGYAMCVSVALKPTGA